MRDTTFDQPVEKAEAEAAVVSSSDDEVEVELLDSVAKVDSALGREHLSSTASQGSEDSESEVTGEDNQRDVDGGGSTVNGDELEQLRLTNDHLRSEVADLTSALLARDLELVRLRERCQFLTTAVEKQDEVIAKIYEATTGDSPISQAAVTALPVVSHVKGKHSTIGGDQGDEDSLTYGEFLQRISLPASRDILDKIRMFVGSILGPRGDGRPPRSTDYVEYDFYGKHEFRRRCTRFFENMEDLLQDHPAWRHASETKLAKARDGIEKYVMDKVSDIACNQLKECQQWMKEDEALLRRMQLLSFITPAMLDIKPCMRNEVVWSMAEDELRRINSFRSPGDKINCIVRCCSVIFSVLNLSRGDSGSRPGADDFLPVFIYIVLHSQIPRLYSNCEYISAYRNQADLMSKAGYCFVNLRSAIEFIMVMDGSMLSISNDEFQRLYSEREKILLKP
ncbi:hypothetical protein G195_009409 [Phytophthora kernoviae 00238/432]|uniref:VPS9 domain-containing protein n=2 Tax=Phytophthora kernoviae TaxID=325452 RepID=A0A8T0LND6_9STRA|nr:hypothetical protein G195_009409 [Phytophthora kernoviae 00238/432]KAG2514142.1 hypothetical protein JM16_007885 [Phytophthora kernoviae]